MFRVIEGGLGGATIVRGPTEADEVRREAARRLKAAGYDDAVAHSFATGHSVPDGLTYLHLQMAYAAAALMRRSPIPMDYRADKYWPAH
ncbi:MAG: hypothetical protein EOP19_10615 [Hyphomicrobiales bacterium]|nr:MAG: hypothetical protein EOP19_10615 [Hyphomicrobiales bacterium]